MTEEFNEKSLDRRSLVKGAAWSVPVIATAVAAPMAAASVTNASLRWSGSETGLLSLALLDGGGLLTAGVLVTVPDEVTLSNGPGAITAQNATITITVGRPSGINLPLGRARGFGVQSFNGTASTAAERTTTYQKTAITQIEYGFPLTTFTRTEALSVPSNGILPIDVVFGLAGQSDLLSISALAQFAVNITIDFGNGNSYSASSSISVPVGAGIL